MNVQKLTKKSIEALQGAQSLAASMHHTQVEQAHVMLSLIMQEEGLIPSLLTKMNADINGLLGELKAVTEKYMRQTGEVDSAYISPVLNSALTEAEQIAAKMHDEYTSVEHIMLGIIKKPAGDVKPLLSKHGITEKAFTEALKSVRGNQRVTGDDPEGTYDALNKYGQNLVALPNDAWHLCAKARQDWS